ncbi:MAG TPA: LysE family translocator, partial [Hyphomicrobiaceae bacterium]|nr:LysE family translocator [Hyphomicrobiaceae bacterium]
MTPDWFLAVTIFALVTCFTPGPNNTMLTASGLNFGFARSMAHVLGVSIGFAGMVLAVALGIGAIFVMFPGLYVALKVVSIIYLLWLAWRIASASPKMGLTEGARPLTLLEGAAFQWVNPKAWTMTLSASTTYVAAESPTQSI